RLRCRLRGLELLFDLSPVAPIGLYERHVQNIDRKLSRRVGLELVVCTQVDDRLHAVVDERAPAFVAQPPDAVGSDDRVELRLAAVLGRMAAEVADVEEAVPDEVAATLQLPRVPCL